MEMTLGGSGVLGMTIGGRCLFLAALACLALVLIICALSR